MRFGKVLNDPRGESVLAAVIAKGRAFDFVHVLTAFTIRAAVRCRLALNQRRSTTGERWRGVGFMGGSRNQKSPRGIHREGFGG